MPPAAPSTRDRLVSSARDLFSGQGYAGTSTRAIAARADCNISLIRHYFGSKDGLMHQVLREGLDAVRDELQAVLASPQPASERITRVVAFLLSHFERRADLMRIVDREILGRRGALPAEVRALAVANVDMLARILAEARRDGTLRRDLDPRMAAVLLVGTIKSYFVAYPVTSRMLGPSTPALRRKLARHISEIFLHGVTP